MDDPSLHTEPPLTEQGDGLGKDMPLRLLHHPALEYLGGVPLQDLHRLLKDDGAVSYTHLTEKTDKGRALARPRKGSFSGTNAEKQADDPLRGLGELGVDHLEQDLGGCLLYTSRCV